jgi:hypothetical protein
LPSILDALLLIGNGSEKFAMQVQVKNSRHESAELRSRPKKPLLDQRPKNSCPIYRPHPRFREITVPRRAGWSRAPALGLDAEERMEQLRKFKWFAMSEALDGKVRQQSGRVRLGLELQMSPC